MPPRGSLPARGEACLGGATRVRTGGTGSPRPAKSYGPIEAVRGISFEVAPGETFGLLGPNGAGKTTTISMLSTLIRPTGGTATVAGNDVAAGAAKVRRNIGLVFQATTLDLCLTAMENLRFHPPCTRSPRPGGMSGFARSSTWSGCGSAGSARCARSSGGMKRRLEIARGLLHRPRVLFLDEPTVGLDPQTRTHIWDYVNQLKAAEDLSIVMTTHYMDKAEHCDRIAVGLGRFRRSSFLAYWQ